MQRKLLAAALAAASILIIPPAFGHGHGEVLGTEVSSPSCTPEAQKCSEKLAALLHPIDRTGYWAGIERALLDLFASDPECATVLWVPAY